MICPECAKTPAPQCFDVCEDTDRERGYRRFATDVMATVDDAEDRERLLKAAEPMPGCDCQHGRPIEQGGDMDPSSPDYVDALPADDPRRLAYEKRVRRSLPGNPKAVVDAVVMP